MDQPSRRSVLRAAVLATAAIAVPGLASRQAAGVSAGATPTRLRRREFTPLVGTTFLLGAGPAQVAARLRSVGDLSRRTAGNDGRFSLLFEIPAAPAEGIYAMRHAVLRTFDLFVTPVAGRAGLYEAVVNS